MSSAARPTSKPCSKQYFKRIYVYKPCPDNKKIIDIN